MQNTTAASNEKDGQIYVLAAAINTYQAEKISNLQGCVKDIDDLSKVLKAQYDIPEENYLILKNEEVSRANLIEAFRSHFSKLKDGDTAVFHYSGHGSWEDGSPEFVEAGLESAGNRNELIVVQNYGEEGVFNIADKELRWMISELQYPKDQAPRNIQFIGLMDCCFSGSLFRDTEKRSRITLYNAQQKRTLSDYLEGQYQKMYKTEGKVAFPDANFILFTACSPRESALEGRNGGLFTQALTKALEDAKSNPPAYADVHTKIQHIIEANSVDSQHPFLEYEGKVNPYQAFLSQQVKAAKSLPPLIKKEEQWITPIGAIHGIQESSWKNSEIQLYAADNFEKAVGTAKLEKIGIEVCTLQPTFFDAKTDTKNLVVGIYGNPLKLKLKVDKGMQSFGDELLERWKALGFEDQIQITDQTSYQLHIQASSIALYHKDQLLTGGEWNPADEEVARDQEIVMDFISRMLQQLIRWEQIQNIQSPKTSIIDEKNIAVQFDYYNYPDETTKKSVSIAPTTEGDGTAVVKIPFKTGEQYVFEIKVKNKDTSPFYFSLVQLDRKYGMDQRFPNYNKKLGYEESRAFESLKEGIGLGISDPNMKSVSQTFLVIASKEALSAPYLFSQKGMRDHFGKISPAHQLLGYKDTVPLKGIEQPARWQVKKIQVELMRE